jgi:hypothetical protein
VTIKLLVLPVAFLAICAAVVAAQSPPVSAAKVYLQTVSDGFQHTVDVYTVADSAGEHFAARGEFDSSGGLVMVPAMDEISSSADCIDTTCITAVFNANGTNWGGWYFMNGVLGPTDRAPFANWGAQPNAGYDLTGATSLQFWARGSVGGERLQFFCFGVGYDQYGGLIAPFPDSSRKVFIGPIALSTAWKRYEIPLSGVDLHYVLGGFGWVAAASDQANKFQTLTFYLADIQFLKDRPQNPRFLVSYKTIKSDNPFDKVERNAAFVYDNAVTLIALIAAGDLGHARTIADAVLYAQSNDRFFTDGRLRNAYQGGDIMLAPGWLPNNKANTVRMPGWYDSGRAVWLEDETQVGTTTGNIAWAMLALLDFYETTGEQKYLQAADELGSWVLANTSDNRGNGGFTGGYDGWEGGAVSGGGSTCASGVFMNGQCKRLYKATEHNIDLYAAFSRLFAAEKLDKWAQAAQQAKTFFLSMWDPIEGKFWTGTDEGGVDPSVDVVPVDIQVWAIQALGAEGKGYLRALDYVESHHRTNLGYGFKQNGGNQCGDSTWFEGTSQVALAYLLVGNSAKWAEILTGVHSVQIPSGGVPATDGTCLNTGFTLNNGQPWEYFPRVHVGATAWLSLAENGVNPFRSDLYSPEPRVSFDPAEVSFGGQDVNSGSAPVTISLTNVGNAPLSISGLSVAGPSSSDFSLQSGSSCTIGGTVQPNAVCTLAVIFNPSAAGARTASITLVDGGLGSPHSVALSGDGRDFALASNPNSPPTQTVSAGQSATYNFLLSPVGGAPENATLGCTISPAVSYGPTCAVSPQTIPLDGVSAVQVSAVVATSSGSPLSSMRQSDQRSTPTPHVQWLVCLVAVLALASTGASSRSAARTAGSLVIIMVAVTLLSCGGSTPTPPSSPIPRTPAGNYKVTLSAAHGSLSKTATVTLVVR